MNENARFWDVLIALCDNEVLSEVRIRLETTLFRLALEGARIATRRDKWIVRHEEILQTLLSVNKTRLRRLVVESVKLRRSPNSWSPS